ncbi:MAG: hypothetical protein ACLQRM_16400 [Acidimicrobiales bacterium]
MVTSRHHHLASTTKRGYGRIHQLLRRQWAARVELGDVQCRRCGRLIHPDEPWDLGHDDNDRSLPAHPEHRACNRATAKHKAERKRAMPAVRRWSEQWWVPERRSKDW